MAYTVPSTKEVPMDTTVAVLVGFVLGVTAVLIGQRLFSRQFLSGMPPARGTAAVTISLDGSGTPTARPDTVSLANGRELIWNIDPRMESGEVEIKFATNKGPFKKNPGNPHHRDQGWYVRGKGDNRPIDSNAAEKTGLWKYSVTYTPDGGQPKTKDPAVCIRN
jgi:hypothetical protein